MGKVLLLLMLFLLSCSVYAESRAFGKVQVTIVNRPPRVMELKILPGEPYYDSVLECSAVVDDESPATVSYEYSWYRNGMLLDDKESSISGLDDGDNILCEAVPIDNLGERGEKKNASTTILSAPASVRIVKPILNFVGISANAAELKSTMSLSAVTGMVTGYRETSGLTLIMLLGIMVAILVAMNIFAFMMHMKKTRSPRRDYGRA